MTADLIQKSKDLSLSIINIQEQTNKSVLDAFSKFAGHDFATYTWGLNYINTETSRYARRFIEELSNFSPTGDKK